MKLQSMTDYVLAEKLMLNIKGYEKDFISKTFNYANFLKQPLTLGMFTPTDENGVVLEEPKKYVNWTNYDYSGTDIGFEDEKLCRQFQQAKERVIFEGFCYFEHQSDFVNSRNNSFEYCVFNYAFPKYGICTYEKNKGFHTYFQLMTIEDLATIKKGITISKTAVKKYGL